MNRSNLQTGKSIILSVSLFEGVGICLRLSYLPTFPFICICPYKYKRHLHPDFSSLANSSRKCSRTQMYQCSLTLTSFYYYCYYYYCISNESSQKHYLRRRSSVLMMQNKILDQITYIYRIILHNAD